MQTNMTEAERELQETDFSSAEKLWLMNWHRKHSQPRVSRDEVFEIVNTVWVRGGTPGKITDAIMSLLSNEKARVWCSHWKYQPDYPDQPWIRTQSNKHERVRKLSRFCDECAAPRPKEQQ